MASISTHIAEDHVKEGSLRDHFLIAMPSLQDPMFSHSVTYICDHTEEGAMGVVINHPLELTMREVFEQLALESGHAWQQTPVLAGGPVNMQRGFVLHPYREGEDSHWQSSLRVTPEISLTGSRDILEAISAGCGPVQAQFILGYAAWQPGQLENEISENSWLTVPAERTIIFDTPVEQRWAAAARQLGVDVNLISSVAGHA